MRLFRNPQATATADDWICIYCDHHISAGEPYISVCYSQERWDGRHSVNVDDSAVMFFAHMHHAPSEVAVIQALRSAGIPVEG